MGVSQKTGSFYSFIDAELQNLHVQAIVMVQVSWVRLTKSQSFLKVTPFPQCLHYVIGFMPLMAFDLGFGFLTDTNLIFKIWVQVLKKRDHRFGIKPSSLFG